MTDLVVTVAVTYPDGTVVTGQASAAVNDAPPAPAAEPEPDFIRRSRLQGMGYR
jgi:hypothetical protein